MSGGKLYKARLDADLELSKDPNRGYNAWNRKRQEAIDRGEDPNSEMLDRIEDRVPDSYLERAYRKVMGKGKTKKEERERREEKERRKTEKLERDGVGLGTADVCGQIGRGNEDDGAIR